MAAKRTTLIACAAIAIALLAGCAGTGGAPDPDVRQVLAPSGKLRVGVYRGSPTSIIGEPSAPDARGVGFDLGRALAGKLGVPFEPVVFPNNAQLLAAVKAGSVDVCFTNATDERARDMDFSPPALDIEKSYLVPPASPIAKIEDIDRPGARIGISQGSSTERELAGEFKHAKLVPAASLKSGIEMLSKHALDAFATNKAILFEMSDDLPGSRVLDGRWGLEHLALAIPKGRDRGRAYVAQFVADMQASGALARSIGKVGLRGTVAPGTR